MAYKTNLSSGTANFNDMMKNGFGVVTVMNAKVYDAFGVDVYKANTAYQIIKLAEAQTPLCSIDTLKIANVTEEGPSKTITGGQFSNPLIKFGKSARLEMQDALGNADAIEALCGGVIEYNPSNISALHFGEDFAGPKMIIGESFFIERKSGRQVKVNIVFYQFLPDSIFNLTQDAEGDATVFDMNGDLMTTVIKVGKNGTDANDLQEHGVFYSIVDPSEVSSTTSTAFFSINVDSDTKKMTIAAATGYKVNNGDSVEINSGAASRVQVTDANDVVVFDQIIKNY